MGVIEKTLSKRAFLDANISGAIGGAYSLEDDVPALVHDHKDDNAMDASNEDDGEDSKLSAVKEDDAAARQVSETHQGQKSTPTSHCCCRHLGKTGWKEARGVEAGERWTGRWDFRHVA